MLLDSTVAYNKGQKEGVEKALVVTGFGPNF